ncbi:cytochrome c class I [Pseudodesulfovibrio mercurii]|uniref:Cytochrome c class I n=1 Tax=Pseudodesulfovibrio mercurii TaxID=641491 RepID=F0JJZ3_9BACT|nr:c-type cytochrome [Pseudodesulfovibrio mercurii]EGB16242.1 cytochrome c class I [Pseudodesulfovibrio mercurii]
MKKLLIALTVVFCFGVTAAFAVDGGELYKKRCANCHRDGTESSPSGGGAVLKGQSAKEIEMKLTGYQNGTYGGAKKKTMERMVSKFTADDIKALADYIGSL